MTHRDSFRRILVMAILVSQILAVAAYPLRRGQTRHAIQRPIRGGRSPISDLLIQRTLDRNHLTVGSTLTCLSLNASAAIVAASRHSFDCLLQSPPSTLASATHNM